MKKAVIAPLIVACLTTLHAHEEIAKPPKLVVVIVIDQFAHHYLPKLSPYFRDGLKLLMSRGTCYENAHHPHGSPSTAPGHAGIGTGTIPYDHGVILNGWIDEDGNKVAFGDDANPSAALLGTQASPGKRMGKSARHILVDTLSDQVVRASTEERPFTVYSLSYKARAAIGMGGNMAHTIWFDSKSGQFTSSKAYFDKLPDWVGAFNKKHDITRQNEITWNLRFDADCEAYNFPLINNRTYATYNRKLAGTRIGLNHNGPTNDGDDDDDFAEVNGCSLFLKTPAANKMLLDLSQQCLAKKFSRTCDGTFLLWVSLSSLDMIGHKYGPDCLEVIDMIYHLDKQLGCFIKFCQKRAGARDTLFVLTADHGVDKIPELLEKTGLTLAQRVLVKPLVKKMNAYLHKKYGYEKAVAFVKVNQFYLNPKTVPASEKPRILQILKKYMLRQPGIKNVWTRDELLHSCYSPDTLEGLFKNQCHPTRSGDLICMVQPFSAVTKHETGAAHRTPYNHDTHVPLILYQEGRCKPRKINQKVWVPQLPVTLAHILGVPKPSSARYECLPLD